ncbi:KICSTOR complex protein SZT2-like isoform X2 [Antedon mediterranea]|uniref:KICSTOR complex protein SZT2-like isoform X2 n=1 Tax=Antedon mediterranea TaxID=105859 RepID=UPI003AF63D01
MIDMDAEEVYLLMKKEYRISRNIRANWFFGNLNKQIKAKSEDELLKSSEELEVLSIIPKPTNTDTKEKHRLNDDEETPEREKEEEVKMYKLVPTSHVHFLARRYRIVTVLDISPSMATVDILSGRVSLIDIFRCFKNCLKGLIQPFTVPGSMLLLKPQIYITVIAYTPLSALCTQQVLVQGCLLTEENLEPFLEDIQFKLEEYEDKIVLGTSDTWQPSEASVTMNPVHFTDGQECTQRSSQSKTEMVTPDIGLVNMIWYGILALQLLPENTSAGMVIITDGVMGMPDVPTMNSLLNQMRSSTIACSFIQVGKGYHPQCSFGYIPHTELMQFIAQATFGAFLSKCPEIDPTKKTEMNQYHQAFLSWHFQKGLDGIKIDYIKGRQFEILSSDGGWHSEGTLPPFARDKKGMCVIPLMKKRHQEKTLHTDIMHVMSLRLREGFTIKDVTFSKNEKQIEVRLALPWRHNDRIEYTAKSAWPLDSTHPLTQIEIMIEGSYEFLHDLTCQIKPSKPTYRMLVIKKFWQALRSVNETDQLLEHLQSFASNAIFYTVPERTKEGMPLLYMPPGSDTPVLSQDLGHSKDSRSRQFADFWKRISLMDPKKWQRWFHTHRIGMVLTHDMPLPKHLHYGNHNGRFNNVQSRLAQSAVNQLLRTWSTFVLLENHSYIKLMYKDGDEKNPPYSFYIIRILSKPPCMVLRLAFLGGTSGHVRNQIMKNLKSRLVKLELPQRASSLLSKTVAAGTSSRHRRVSGNTDTKEQQKQSKANPCVVLISKPTEIILIRYEWIPHDFFNMEASMSVTASSLPTISSHRSHHQHHSHQHSPPRSLNRLACYFHHRRWIWEVQKDENTPQVSEQAMSTILTTLREIRLKEGFHFAYSNVGIISLVIELKMKESSAAVLCEDELDLVKSRSVTLTEKLFERDPGTKENQQKATKLALEKQSELSQLEDSNYALQMEDLKQADLSPSVLSKSANSERQTSPENICTPKRGSFSETSSTSKRSSISEKGSIEDKQCNDEDQLEDDKLDNFPCLLQYVIFPVHHASRHNSFCAGVDENAELEFQPAEEDSMLQLVTECWIEPQSGIVQATDNHKYLQDLAYDEVLNQIFPNDKEVISAFLSYESLKARCGRNEDYNSNQPEFTRAGHQTNTNLGLEDGSIQFVPFDVDLVKIISRSQQARMLFPTFIEVNKRKPAPNEMIKMSTNEIYFREIINSFTHESASHTKLMLSSRECVQLLEHLESRQSTEMSAESPDDSVDMSELSNLASKLLKISSSETEQMSDSVVPQMVCCLYSMEGRLILTIMPASYKDLVKLNHLQGVLLKESSTKDKVTSVEVSQILEDNAAPDAENVERAGEPYDPDDDVFEPPTSDSLPLPIFVYNCHRHELRQQLLGEPKSNKFKDIFEDLTFNTQDNSTGTTNTPTSLQPEFDNYRKKLTDFVHQSFVISVFQSLRMQQYVHKDDVQAAVDSFCEESLHQVDLTEFVKAVCGHVMDFNRKMNNEQGNAERLPSVIRFANPILKSKKRTSVTDGLLFSTQSIDLVSQEIDRDIEYKKKRESYSFPVSDLKSNEACEISQGIHENIKAKFKEILSNRFKPVPSNPDFWFFCTPIMDDDSEFNIDFDTEDGENDGACSVPLSPHMLASASGSPSGSTNMEGGTSFLSEDTTPSDYIMDTFKFKQSLTNSDLSHDKYASSNESVMGSVIESHTPLFMHLTCSVKMRSYRGNLETIASIPTCLGELIECLEDEVDSIDLSDMSVTLDIICLTLPPLGEWDEGVHHDRRRYTSLCESTPPSSPPPLDLKGSGVYSITTSEADFGVMSSGDPLLCLPEAEQAAIKETEEQIKWLLQDEIASAKRSIYPVTLNTLDMVAKHINNSTCKPSCVAKDFPLKFVFGHEHSLKKFIKEFENIELKAYQLTKVKDFYYLTWNNEEIEKKRKIEEEKQLKLKLDITDALNNLGKAEAERPSEEHDNDAETKGGEDPPVSIIFTPPSPKKLPKTLKERNRDRKMIESVSDSDEDEVTPRVDHLFSIDSQKSETCNLEKDKDAKRDDSQLDVDANEEGDESIQQGSPAGLENTDEQPRNADDNISRSSGSSIQVLPEDYDLERTSSVDGECSVVDELVTSLEEAKIDNEMAIESGMRSRDSSIVVLNEFVDNFINEEVNEEGGSTVQGDEEESDNKKSEEMSDYEEKEENGSNDDEEEVITARQTSRSSTGSTITSCGASNESSTETSSKIIGEIKESNLPPTIISDEVNDKNEIKKDEIEKGDGLVEPIGADKLKLDKGSSTSTYNTPTPGSGSDSPIFLFNSKFSQKNYSAFSSETPSSQISYTSQEDTSWDEEKGYDADSSGDEEGEMEDSYHSSVDVNILKIPDFWLIAKIEADKVNVYFHTGISQEEDTRYKEQFDVVMKLIGCIENTCRIVNQSLLLLDLNETRLCHTLLVPQSDEDIFEHDKRSRSEIDEDDIEDPVLKKKGYLAASMSFEPGIFACKEVFSINIPIHPRLKSTSTESTSKGLLQVINTLSAFSVNNRRNMFVYKDKSGGVFYLRLSETSIWSQGANSPIDSCIRTADDRPASRTPSLSSLPTLDVTDDTSSLLTTKTDSSIGSYGSSNTNQHMVHVAIYGITEASPEIKEELIMVLKNKINVATLKVITFMLVRNAQCKLTPEDVHFIQPPKRSEKRPSLTKSRFSSIEEDSELSSVPEVLEEEKEVSTKDQGEPTEILLFTIPVTSNKYLSSVKYYLQQNLLQFLHMPKYVDQRQENHLGHFRPYHDEDNNRNMYLYIRPQASGGLGIACISMSTVLIGVDGKSKLMTPLACPKPLPNSYKEHVHEKVFDNLTNTNIYQVPVGSNKPGPTSLIEFSIWERGDVDMPSLTKKLLNTVRHSLCDTVMEYLILTAPLGVLPDMYSRRCHSTTSPPMTPTDPNKVPVDITLSSSSSPVNIKLSANQHQITSSRESTPKERKKPTMSASPGQLSTKGLQLLFQRSQSVSTESSVPSETPPKSKKGGSQQYSTGESPRTSPRPSPKPSPSSSQSPSVSPSKQLKGDPASRVPSWKQQEIESRQQQALSSLYQEAEEGLTASLHEVYKDTAIDWLEFEHKLEVPSVRKQKLKLSSRFAVQTVLHELLHSLYSNYGDCIYKLYKKKDKDFNLVNTNIISDSSKYKPFEVGFESESNNSPCDVNDYILIGRNIKQWRSMLYNNEESMSMPSLVNTRTHKSVQKFDPLVISSLKPKDIFLNIPRDNTHQKHIDAYSIPRQRLLLLHVVDTELSLYTYNWSLENTNHLEKTLSRLVRWHNSRASLLNSIVYQKIGIFHFKKMVQPPSRQKNLFSHSTPSEVDELVRSSRPPKRDHESRHYTLHGTSRNKIPGLPSLNEVFRNARLRKPMQSCTYGMKRDPLLQHGSQLQEVYHIAKKDAEKRFKLQSLYLEWQKRVPQPISEEMLNLLKKNSRLIHYCCTPLLFSPEWRGQVMHSHALKLSPQTQPKSEQPWHIDLRSTYVSMYIQYLQQRLGFMQIQTTDTSPRKSLSNKPSKHSPRTRRSSSFYSVAFLRKVVPGGIILLQLAFENAYFCVMLYAFESSRVPAGEEVNSQLCMRFTDEVNKLKDTIHLHSFTYDFHLRKIQSCISPTSRIIFKPDYHVTSFLDDFIKYFQVLPNFSRNEIFKGTEEFKSEGAASNLYRYIVDQCNSHHMSRLRMSKVGSNEGQDEHDFAIFCYYQRKLQRLSDDFDVSIIVDREQDEQARDGIDSEILKLKYYVIVTNNKEMFPKLTVNSPLGRLHFKDKLPKEESQCYLLVRKEASVARDKIKKMVKQGAYNSRRDFLWRLLPSGETAAVRKRRRETLDEDFKKGRKRDTVEDDTKFEKTLSYAELKELLGMVHHKPLNELDPQLKVITDMPLTWFEVLIKALQTRFKHSCLFASDDRNQLHLVIINPNNTDMLVHISIDKLRNKSELSSVFRDPAQEQMAYSLPEHEQVSMFSTQKQHQHIENIISFICYHLWSCIL